MAAIFVSLLGAMTLMSVDTAEARKGGSFGSRGVRTHQSVPATQTTPNATAPLQNTTTPRTAQQPGAAAAQQRNGMFGGGIGGMIMGGLLFGGLFGLLAGTGFGGLGGLLGLLVQGVLIFFVVRWLFRKFGPQVQSANGAPSNGGFRFEGLQGAGGGGAAASGPRSNASKRAGRRDEIGITDDDLAAFEKRLGEVQEACSREDEATLRRIATPEVADYLSRELEENREKGIRSEVVDVHLLSGDVAEAWREADQEFATVALHYRSRDLVRERITGEVVEGEDRVAETTEVWTFVRRRGGEWLLSAVQA